MDILAGAGASLRVDFLDPLGTIVPDIGSVFWSLYATDGTLLSGPTAITTDATYTGVTISVPGASNTVTPPRQFEKRTVTVTLAVGGNGRTYRASYRVIPFLNMTAGPADVRGVIGVDEYELPDEAIDLVGAYFLVLADINPAGLMTAALANGGRTELLANQAIVGQAVSELFSGVPSATPLSGKEGTIQFQRSAPKWQPVIQQARDMRARGIAAILGVLETPQVWVVPMQRCDPFTEWHGRLSWP
jgi:hypothetical protein